MKRVIVDFKKLTPEILALLVDKYPFGYDEDDIIRFTNSKNEKIEAVEVRTDDSIYLVKISSNLVDSMATFDIDDYSDEDQNTPIVDIPDSDDETNFSDEEE
jgi:hypothetical protein